MRQVGRPCLRLGMPSFSVGGERRGKDEEDGGTTHSQSFGDTP